MGHIADSKLLAGAADWIREMTEPWSKCEHRDELLIHIRWGDLQTTKDEFDHERIISQKALKMLYEAVKVDQGMRRDIIPRILMENHNNTMLDAVFGKGRYEVVNTENIQRDVGRLACASTAILAESDFSLMAAHAAEGTFIYYPVEVEDRYHWSTIENVKGRGYSHRTGELHNL